jgi:hypothetical protein
MLYKSLRGLTKGRQLDKTRKIKNTRKFYHILDKCITRVMVVITGVNIMKRL